MMQLRGLWYWTGDIVEAVKLAKCIEANTMILKVGYHDPIYTGPIRKRLDYLDNAKKCRDAGLLVAAEVFSMPHSVAGEADILKWAVTQGHACSVVLNAETPHESDNGSAIQRFAQAFGQVAPIYACTDMRGNRLSLPYHQELAKIVTGWMPMAYPRTFYPDTPFGDLQRAFDAVYWRWKALGPNLSEPGRSALLLPALQAYDGLDYEETLGQILLAHIWGSPGSSFYASHDVNARAAYGIRDGWRILSALHDAPDWMAVADAAGTAAHDAVLAQSKLR